MAHDDFGWTPLRAEGVEGGGGGGGGERLGESMDWVEEAVVDWGGEEGGGVAALRSVRPPISV